MSTSIQQLEEFLSRELGRVVVGAQTSVQALVIALLSRGHVLAYWAVSSSAFRGRRT
jgi:hypothetical protein